MATKQLKKNKIEKGLDTVKTQVSKLNKESIQFSDQMVDSTLASSAQWQKLFAKALKNGTTLLGKQQDIVFDTIEELKNQSIHGGSRLMELLEIKRLFKSTKNIKLPKKVSETIEAVKAEAEDITAMAEEAKDSVKGMVKKATNFATTSANKATKKVTKKPVVQKAKVVKVKAAKKVKTIVAKTAKKKVIKKATTKTDSLKNDLKVIEGIGPKIESLLVKANIKTFKKLATTNVKVLKEILEAAGPRYKMHNPTTWTKQAKLAAAGKWSQLKTLQASIKGGKI